MAERIITWEMRGFRDVLGRFTKASKSSRRFSRDIARDVAKIAVERLKRYAPVGTHYKITSDGSVVEYRPETLKKSIAYRTFSRSWGTEVRIYAAEHVKYVINPTRPHRIRAKNVRFLRFYWADAPAEVVEMFGGNVVYFQSVWHPGTRANPFHERALLDMEPDLTHSLNRGAVQFKEILEGT